MIQIGVLWNEELKEQIYSFEYISLIPYPYPEFVYVIGTNLENSERDP